MTAGTYLQPHGVSRSGVAFVVALHVVAFWLLLQTNVISLPAPPAVLNVHLIQAAATIRPEPPVMLPKPVERRLAPTPQPAPLAVPTEATIAAAPAAAPPSPPAPATMATAPAPAPLAPSAPRFDADYLDNPKPVYPSLSRRLGEEGKVVLRVHVRPDGRTDEVLLHAGSRSPRLDQSALEAVRRWRFVPARQGEAAVGAWVLVPIVFTLKD